MRYFLLSDAVVFLVSPLGFAILVGVLGLILLRWRKGGAAVAFILALAVLWVSSAPLFADFLKGSLEKRYPYVKPQDVLSADAIVVLGGCLGRSGPPDFRPDLSAASDRLLHAARLYRSGKAPAIVVTGGGAGRSGPPESDLMAVLLTEWGVPGNAIIKEPESRSTRENARYTKDLLQDIGAREVLLVTSAVHMLRAAALFRALGVNVVPAPTDYTAGGRKRIFPLDFLPDTEALGDTTRAVKEYVGYVLLRTPAGG